MQAEYQHIVRKLQLSLELASVPVFQTHPPGTVILQHIVQVIAHLAQDILEHTEDLQALVKYL